MKLLNWIKKLFTKKVIIAGVEVLPPLPKPTTGHTSTTSNPNFQHLWDTMVIHEPRMDTIKWYVSKSYASQRRYEAVSVVTGVPWKVIAVVHGLEGSFNFESVLHNGEKILGAGRKTKLVPKGRGPFTTWEEAAIDALKIKALPKTWGIVETLDFLHKFNGTGYLKKGIYSPYLWSFSNHYYRGKYVSDGRYDANAISSQCGAAVLLKQLGFGENG